jgi:hypothetical protein
MQDLNLNNLFVPSDDGSDETLKDFSLSIDRPQFDNIEVIFKNLEPRLLELIKEFEGGAIFGCVAWLTSIPILKALSKCNNVQIVVQKEDFLRPDLNSNYKNWKASLRSLYNSLKCDMERHQFKSPMGDLSVCSDPTVDPIRCVGNHNAEKQSAFPRSHHKFLVFCKIDDKGNYIPIKLWTGSFNLTKNATYSFENALIFADNLGTNKLINSYLMEHHQIFSLSESLDWTEDWSTPEFRIGT